MTSLFWSLLFGSLVMEDVGLLSAVALVAHDKIGLPEAALASFLGITIGNLGLYYLGFLALHFPALAEQKWFKKLREKFGLNKPDSWTATAVFICRFIPGTRVPTYIFAGFVRYPFLKYLFVMVLSVVIWVGLVFQIGSSAKQFITEHVWASAIIVTVFLVIAHQITTRKRWN